MGQTKQDLIQGPAAQTWKNPAVIVVNATSLFLTDRDAWTEVQSSTGNLTMELKAAFKQDNAGCSQFSL